MTPYYEDDAVTIFHGDCRGIVHDLPADIDATLADPPYGETSLEWDQWPTGWTGSVALALRPSAPLWCFGSMRMFLDHGSEFAAVGWRLAQDVIWEKHNGSSFHADRFKRVHESALQWYRGPWGDVYKDPQTTADATKRTVRRKERPPHTGEIEGSSYASVDGGPKLARSVLFVSSCHGDAVHPTQKPLGIIRPLLLYSVPVGGLVLDPFAGSGSTLVAARESGRRAIGIEAREDYCEIAATRLSQSVLDFGGAA